MVSTSFMVDTSSHPRAQLHRCVERSAYNFTAKAADVVGLYVAPPAKAIVLCVDEKPSIQALERAQGI
ncbi:hypothetical protein ACVIJW_004140 [Bradyrhizobium barranii subsp. barranii]